MTSKDPKQPSSPPESLHQAEGQVRSSQEGLERAMDHLKVRVGESSEKVHEIRDRAEELVDSVKDARETFEELVSEAAHRAEQYVSEKRETVEKYIAESAQSIETSLKSGVESTLTELKGSGEKFLGETEQSLDHFFRSVRQSADQVLKLADEKSVSSFLMVFLSGAALGMMAARRRATMRRPEGVRPGERALRAAT